MAPFIQLIEFAEVLAAFCLAVGVVVFIHEFGHYFAARCCGIIATSFSLGIGPTVIERQDRNGTRWKLSLLPIGGYVSFPTDMLLDGTSGQQESRRAGPASMLEGVSLASRFMIVVAGPLANFLLAICLFATIYAWNGQVRTPVMVDSMKSLPSGEYGLRAGDEIIDINGHPIVSAVDLYYYDQVSGPDDVHRYRVKRETIEETVSGPYPTPVIVGNVSLRSAAEAAGVETDDVIIGVDGTPVYSFQQLREHVLASEGREIVLRIWRDGSEFDLPLSGRFQDIRTASGNYTRQVMIGITHGLAFDLATITPGPFTALYAGLYQTWSVIGGTFEGISGMIAQQISSCNMQGVIGIAQVSSSAASQGMDVFIMIIAILSVAIGVMNLLPVPVLDGGYLAFYLYEAITGRTPAEGFLRWAFGAGMTAVIILLSFAVYQDLTCVR